MNTDHALYAGVELGGTKIVVGLGRADGTLLERTEIPTRDPVDSLRDIGDILEGYAARYGPARGLGIATFGPVHLDPARETYGRIGPTPKLAWRGVELVRGLGQRFGGPIEIQTDVIGAALGEARWGAGVGYDPLVYVTVGTGIGGGVIANGRPITGLLHPEVGHMRAPRAPGDDYGGGCAVHGDCLEGMAAGPSIIARWGARLGDLSSDHPAYPTIAHYLAHLVTNLVLCVSPRRVLLGGGVMSNARLFPLIRADVRALLNGFVAVDELEAGISDYIVPPGLGSDSGVLGAIAMAVDGAGGPSA